MNKFAILFAPTKVLYIFLICYLNVNAQTGSVSEPVRYIGGESIDPAVHEGRLRYAIGVENRQSIRVNRTKSIVDGGVGWTYSHASNLAYWDGKFYQQYLSNPVDEHIPPGRTLLTTSEDGRSWSTPRIIFPPYEPPSGVELIDSAIGYMMHQRMGFYVTSDDRLLLLAFYGHAEDPFTVGGIGRVVREIYKDQSLGPIYFIKYDSHTSWDETNTSYPYYASSEDAGFIRACDELLADKLMTLQWWDEDHGDDFHQVKEAGEALSYYHRKDGNVVALWKRSKAALSFDGGITFSSPARVPTFTMAGGKVWGQRTKDDRFAMVYNPIELDEYRYPLVLVSGDDGIIYDDMLLVQGEVPPRRFDGRWKDFGPCYVRGIVEGNGTPPGNDLWLSYSMNKEDIWVSRVPLPVTYRVDEDVQDDFENCKVGAAVENWNIYAPLWAPIDIIEEDGNNRLALQDFDPYDYARAIRVFRESSKTRIAFDVKPMQSNRGILEIDLTDRYGERPVRIVFDSEGQIKALNGSEEVVLQKYEASTWYKFRLKIDANPYGGYQLKINEQVVLNDAQLAVAVKSVERFSARTGKYRDLPTRTTPNQDNVPPLPGADDQEETSTFLIDNFMVENLE